MAIPVRDWMRKHDDAASRYAVDILDGKVVANTHMKNAAARHFNDLDEGKFIWAPEKAERPIRFIESVTNVRAVDSYDLVPMRLSAWQRALMVSLHGWRVGHNDAKRRIPGVRRFERVFLTTGKSAGKTGLFAAHLMYLLCHDGYRDLRTDKWVDIQRHTSVISATTLDQVRTLALRPLIAMLEDSPVLTDPKGFACTVEGGEQRPSAIFSRHSGGRIIALTSRKEGKGLGGRLIQNIHSEEIQESGGDLERWTALTMGFKNAAQPVHSIALNASQFTSGLAYREYMHAVEAAKGTGMDNMLAFIYSLDEGDYAKRVDKDDWAPPYEVWRKANPGLDDSVPPESYIHGAIDAARTLHARNEVNRLNFGCWRSYGHGLLSRELLERAALPKAQPRIQEDDMVDHELFCGLDLAQSNDLSSLAFLWRDGEGKYYLKVKNYLPEGRLEFVASRCAGDIKDFVDSGLIRLVPGAINTYRELAADIIAAYEKFDLRGIACDPHNIVNLFAKLEEAGAEYSVEGKVGMECTWTGIHFVIHKQGFSEANKTGLAMHTSIGHFEELFANLHDDGNPLITIEYDRLLVHAVESAVVKENENDVRKITKRDAANTHQGKIDPLMASIFAAGLAARGVHPEKEYNPGGIYASPTFNPAEFIV